MLTFTHVQQVPFKLDLKDWKGKPIPFEDAELSTDDSTVAVVDPLVDNGDGTWSGVLRGIAPSPDGVTNRLTVTVDTKMGEGIEAATAMLEFQVTLDARPGAKILEIVAGEAVDQP